MFTAELGRRRRRSTGAGRPTDRFDGATLERDRPGSRAVDGRRRRRSFWPAAWTLSQRRRRRDAGRGHELVNRGDSSGPLVVAGHAAVGGPATRGAARRRRRPVRGDRAARAGCRPRRPTRVHVAAAPIGATTADPEDLLAAAGTALPAIWATRVHRGRARHAQRRGHGPGDRHRAQVPGRHDPFHVARPMELVLGRGDYLRDDADFEYQTASWPVSCHPGRGSSDCLLQHRSRASASSTRPR